jgi:hypothetical protein
LENVDYWANRCHNNDNLCGALLMSYTVFNNDGDLYEPEHRIFKTDSSLWDNVVDEIRPAIKEGGYMEGYDYPIESYSVDWTKNEIMIFFGGLPDG